VDGLEQSPSERHQASKTPGLNKKMDMLLSCLEQFGIEAGALLAKANESGEKLSLTEEKIVRQSLFQAGEDKRGKDGDGYDDWS
jgi:hypothetical protein